MTHLKLFATNITGVPELGLVSELVLLTTRLTLNFLPQISQVCPNLALWVSWCSCHTTHLKLFATNITGVSELGLVGELVLLPHDSP